MNKIKPEYSTDNFQLASYLLCVGFPIYSVNKENPRRAQFYFESSETLHDAIRTFMSYEATVEPHRFFSAQKDIKQMIYAK